MSWITTLTRCKVNKSGTETIDAHTEHGSMYGTYNPLSDILSEASNLGYAWVEMSTKHDNKNNNGTLRAKTSDGKFIWRTATYPAI